MNECDFDSVDFWNRANKGSNDTCWPWKEGKTKHGYGQYYCGLCVHYSHRVAYELTNGRIPDGFEVLHTCDNPSCVNPTHLKAGTHADNMADMTAKNRNPGRIGELSPKAKLTWEHVAQIRDLYKTGLYSHRELGTMFAMSNRQICNILLERCWRRNNEHE